MEPFWTPFGNVTRNVKLTWNGKEAQLELRRRHSHETFWRLDVPDVLVKILVVGSVARFSPESGLLIAVPHRR